MGKISKVGYLLIVTFNRRNKFRDLNSISLDEEIYLREILDKHS